MCVGESLAGKVWIVSHSLCDVTLYLFGVSVLYLWALQLYLQAVWGRDRQDSHSTSSSTNCVRQIGRAHV